MNDVSRNILDYLGTQPIDVPVSDWPGPIDLKSLLSGTPTPPQYVVDGCVPAGYATLIAGHGGAGKSQVALHMACCIATGSPWLGRSSARRRVLFLSCEDRTDVLHWRLARIAAYEGLSPDDLASGLSVLDLVGRDVVLFRRAPVTGSGTTSAYSALLRAVSETRAEVVFIDGTSDTFGGNENDRGDVKAFINAVLGAIGESGAVVLVAHVNKLIAGGRATEGYSGSTGWHNGVRARWYLYPETEHTDEGTESTGVLRLDLQKNNLGNSDVGFRLAWNDGAHMFLPVGEADAATTAEDEQEAIVAALHQVLSAGDYCPAAVTGPRTAHHVLSSVDGFPEALKNRAGKRRFWRHIEKLRRMGIARESSIARADRHRIATLTLSALEDNGAGNAGNGKIPLPADSPQPAHAGNAGIAARGYRGARAHSRAERTAADYRLAKDGE